MPLEIRSKTIKEFLHWHTDNELDLSPDYQRREAWSEKKQMILIDSIARRVPISAITLYRTIKDGVTVYEVIDGKQRLTAIVNYRADRLTPLRAALNGLSEEEEAEGEELAEKVLDRKWSELDKGTQSSFSNYEIPIYIVDGSRASAVRAFRRMNADPYALKPQEIRNAIFKDSAFLKSTRDVAERLEKWAQTANPFFVEWGLVEQRQWDRMQDLQFLSELLCLGIEGPQEARRSLDEFYGRKYEKLTAKTKKELSDAADETERAIKAVHSILGDNLRPHNFDNENDFYCLIGAIFECGIPSSPQLNNEDLVADVSSALSEFKGQVLLCQEAMTDGADAELQVFPKEVRDYAGTLMKGQVNSAKRRQSRIDILATIIGERVKPIDPRNPSDWQRRIVWLKSSDKKCVRCGKAVKWDDFDCGHADAKAFGGRAVLSNLRVEHSWCNRSEKEK